ncbi:ABC transporter substrate-binding protein [Roseovarius sp. EL26]|uniref:ABC transporter substrate-binding protein n=1 Tax=Roseovarius sp. EL26 TaxID=2126672 RepID=UPI001C1F9FCF|nr:ABC transporter substrate-binding protein [Roseovarius sp. EL26]
MDPISESRFYYAILATQNKLVRIAPDGRPEGSLAVSWEASDDATDWTFKLREGVKFHDGTEFDATDVIKQFDRIKDPANESPLASALALVDSVEAVDDHTVTFHLNNAHADFPLLLTDYRVRMVPSEAGEELAETGVGTGPFKLETLDAEGTTVLVANPDYWEGAPKLDQIEIVGIADAQARVQAMLGGQIDWLLSVNAQQAPLFANNPGFQTQSYSAGDWKGISFDVREAPYDDPRVRKALRMVVDRKAMAELVVGPNGGTVSCDNPVFPADQYRADLSCEQDIEGAKALLAEAGYPDGIDIEISTSDLDQHWVNIAEVYQQQAAEAGINVSINMTPSDGYWSDVWMKDPAFLSWWSARPADQILNEAFRGGASWNESRYSNADFDANLDAARSAPTFEERAKLYGEAQELLWKEGATMIPFHLNITRVLGNGVSGFDEIDEQHTRWHLINKE